MTAAIFGLIGVIVGGLLNLGVAAWQEHRRDRLRVRPVARLVMRELRDWQALLHAAERRGSDYGLPPSKAWPAGAERLAAVVDGRTWAALDDAYMTAEYLTVRPEGEVPLRAAMGGPAPDQYAISIAIRVAQQQLMHYVDMPDAEHIATSLERRPPSPRSLLARAPSRLTETHARFWAERWKRLLPPPADAQLRASDSAATSIAGLTCARTPRRSRASSPSCSPTPTGRS